MNDGVIEEPESHLECDVLVVGGGGAALRAATAAAEAGADVILATKGRLGRSGATSFGVAETAGFAVPDGKRDPDDCPATFFDDVMTNALGCADERLVSALVGDAVGAAAHLRACGVEFMREQTGEELVAMGDFASRPRNRKIYDHGKPISARLAEEARRLGVRVQQRTTVVDLIITKGAVTGGVALTHEGTPLVISAHSTVLATGGAGQLFTRSLMPPDITGGGYVLGLGAGARLVNMEFIQAGFGTVHGGVNMVMSWYWRMHPELLDTNYEHVCAEDNGVTRDEMRSAKARHYPFTGSDPSRHLDIAAKRALVDVVGTAEERLYLDFREGRRSGDEQEARFWAMSEKWLKAKGIDVREKPMEVALFGHSVNGGLVVTPDGSTDVPGLYAAGEVTGGAYGADRLGGNMLLACQVFGRRAGEAAARRATTRSARHVSRVGWSRLDWLRGLGRRETAPSAFELRRCIKRDMTRGALIDRTDHSLREALAGASAVAAALDAGEVDVTSPRDALVAHEVRNLCTVGEVVATVALQRRESRGSHYRSDFLATSPKFGSPLFVAQRGGQLTVANGRFETIDGR